MIWNEKVMWLARGSTVCFLFIAFLLFFRRIKWLKVFSRLMKETKEGMDEASRKRLLENRQQLALMQRENSLWFYLEQQLNYSGLKIKFPFLTAEIWLLGNIVILSAMFLVLLAVFGIKAAGAGSLLLFLIECIIIWLGKEQALKSVNNNLLKFLDFLGNYSITAGEVTSIFSQIGKYLDEPLKSVLEECSYEAQTTGDSGMALLIMADKIEHPKFKELARNIEISIRYCADFSMLVNSSRRTVREYLRTMEERKGMFREAAINMLLLLIMSFVVLMTVDNLIEVSIWHILKETWPGRIALMVLFCIFFLFLRKIHKINR